MPQDSDNLLASGRKDDIKPSEKFTSTSVSISENISEGLKTASEWSAENYESANSELEPSRFESGSWRSSKSRGNKF
ncbi:hypothetical protein H0H81_009765 [Sphagnurus paluster]|uniref:Uncharacterized protein n=1 Tax=Sphagnurus paluster TaxID=117069 RepID=A0A9P7FRW4_9AGAR|nr:hypothetical protein H0H81_009765 [Sphagnurus paluster]